MTSTPPDGPAWAPAWTPATPTARSTPPGSCKEITWKSLHLQPAYAGRDAVGGDVAAGLFERGLCLPSGSNLSTADQERVIDIVREQSQPPP
jgi:hypothetical protein